MPETVVFGEESLNLSIVKIYGPNEIQVIYAGKDIDTYNRAIPDEIVSEIIIDGCTYRRSGSGVTPKERMYLYSPQNVVHDDAENHDE